MVVFEIVIALLLGGAALAAVARRVAVPYPSLVAMAGAALAFFPRVPTLMLDPELALALFVAPVLLDAAYDASPRDLRSNWGPVASLALGVVALTIAVVACVAHAMVPGLPWFAAIALGAIVAPTDATAATTVLRQLRPPHRLLVILEGESLFNDVSALLVYRLAVGASVAGAISGWTVVPTLLVVTIGSLVLGVVLARITVFISSRIRDVATGIIVQFCGTFAVWQIAEGMHLSGVLTMVVFAMSLSRPTSAATPARMRLPSFAVWEVAVFALNILAFILVGFQLRGIVAQLDRATLIRYGWVAAAVCTATIVTRMVWVAAALTLRRLLHDKHALSGRAAVVAAWCGMRGTLTLAAALALPAADHGTAGFPGRDVILFAAVAVVLSTLVLQGVTLRPLLAIVKLDDDDQVEREVRLARVETLRAALEASADCEGAETADLVRRRYELLLRRAEADVAQAVGERDRAAEEQAAHIRSVIDADAAVVRVATTAERRRLMALRDDGTIGDAAFQVVQQELDWAELDMDQLVRT
jgi:CPA1 family monovalent cation:H+ antiporter